MFNTNKLREALCQGSGPYSVIRYLGTFLLALLLLYSIAPSAQTAFSQRAEEGEPPPSGTAFFSGSVSGVVTAGPQAQLPDEVLVKLISKATNDVVDERNVDDEGAFSFEDVINGAYVLIAMPPVDSVFTPSLPKPLRVQTSAVDIGLLRLTKPQIVGTVTEPEGTNLSAAKVKVHGKNGRMLKEVEAIDGTFQIGGLPKGEYTLKSVPTGDGNFWESAPLFVEITDVTSEIEVRLTLAEAALWGSVLHADMQPVAGAKVVVVNQDGRKRQDQTNLLGQWAIGDLPDGEYRIQALPPLSMAHLLPPPAQEVMLPGVSLPMTFTLVAPNKVVTGTVMSNVETPIDNAIVIARRTDRRGTVWTETNVDGEYELALTSGLWSLTLEEKEAKDEPTVKPVIAAAKTQVTAEEAVEWINPEAPRFVLFGFDNLPELQVEHFTVLTADASVAGKVTMPGGGVPPFSVTVGLHNDEGVGVRVKVKPEDGTFEKAMPNGNYKISVVPKHRAYAGPSIAPLLIEPEGRVNLGPIALVGKDAVITGTVADVDGVGIEGVQVNGWSADSSKGAKAYSGADGHFALYVTPGTWHLQAAPGPNLGYIVTEEPASASVASGETVGDVALVLTTADAVIAGVLMDEEGNPLIDLDGWVQAKGIRLPEQPPLVNGLDASSRQTKNGAPIVDGTFELNVPAGDYTVVARPAPASEYLAFSERKLQIATGETLNISLTMTSKSSAIGGFLWDQRSGDIVTGVEGRVSGWSQGNVVVGKIDPDNGAYQIGVSPGVWKINYRIAEDADYVKTAGARNAPIGDERTAVLPVPLPVLAKDATISGKILDPDGAGLPGAVVLLKGTEDHVQRLLLKTRTKRDGTFEMKAPHGAYRLGASIVGQGWIRPIESSIVLSETTESNGHALQFLEPTALITGTLTISNAMAAGLASDTKVKAWAWSDDGGFTAGRFDVSTVEGGDTATGIYSLRVLTGTTWHVGSSFETSDSFWRGLAATEMMSPTKRLDLVLNGPNPKPGPVLVTFDAADAQTVELADGTSIYIPGGAMPVEGQVTLRVLPLADLPNQNRARVVNYGYAFIATDADGEEITESFNQEVIVTFAYDEATLADGSNPDAEMEEALQPAYFSTTTDEWTRPESYAVDAEENVITMQIDHFTDFAILTEATGTAAEVVDEAPDNGTDNPGTDNPGTDNPNPETPDNGGPSNSNALYIPFR